MIGRLTSFFDHIYSCVKCPYEKISKLKKEKHMLDMPKIPKTSRKVEKRPDVQNVNNRKRKISDSIGSVEKKLLKTSSGGNKITGVDSLISHNPNSELQNGHLISGDDNEEEKEEVVLPIKKRNRAVPKRNSKKFTRRRLNDYDEIAPFHFGSYHPPVLTEDLLNSSTIMKQPDFLHWWDSVDKYQLQTHDSLSASDSLPSVDYHNVAKEQNSGNTIPRITENFILPANNQANDYNDDDGDSDIRIKDVRPITEERYQNIADPKTIENTTPSSLLGEDFSFLMNLSLYSSMDFGSSGYDIPSGISAEDIIVDDGDQLVQLNDSMLQEKTLSETLLNHTTSVAQEQQKQNNLGPRPLSEWENFPLHKDLRVKLDIVPDSILRPLLLSYHEKTAIVCNIADRISDKSSEESGSYMTESCNSSPDFVSKPSECDDEQIRPVQESVLNHITCDSGSQTVINDGIMGGNILSGCLEAGEVFVKRKKKSSPKAASKKVSQNEKIPNKGKGNGSSSPEVTKKASHKKDRNVNMSDFENSQSSSFPKNIGLDSQKSLTNNSVKDLVVEDASTDKGAKSLQKDKKSKKGAEGSKLRKSKEHSMKDIVSSQCSVADVETVCAENTCIKNIACTTKKGVDNSMQTELYENQSAPKNKSNKTDKDKTNKETSQSPMSSNTYVAKSPGKSRNTASETEKNKTSKKASQKQAKEIADSLSVVSKTLSQQFEAEISSISDDSLSLGRNNTNSLCQSKDSEEPVTCPQPFFYDNETSSDLTDLNGVIRTLGMENMLEAKRTHATIETDNAPIKSKSAAISHESHLYLSPKSNFRTHSMSTIGSKGNVQNSPERDFKSCSKSPARSKEDQRKERVSKEKSQDTSKSFELMLSSGSNVTAASSVATKKGNSRSPGAQKSPKTDSPKTSSKPDLSKKKSKSPSHGKDSSSKSPGAQKSPKTDSPKTSLEPDLSKSKKKSESPGHGKDSSSKSDKSKNKSKHLGSEAKSPKSQKTDFVLPKSSSNVVEQHGEFQQCDPVINSRINIGMCDQPNAAAKKQTKKQGSKSTDVMVQKKLYDNNTNNLNVSSLETIRSETAIKDLSKASNLKNVLSLETGQRSRKTNEILVKNKEHSKKKSSSSHDKTRSSSSDKQMEFVFNATRQEKTGQKNVTSKSCNSDSHSESNQNKASSVKCAKRDGITRLSNTESDQVRGESELAMDIDERVLDRASKMIRGSEKYTENPDNTAEESLSAEEPYFEITVNNEEKMGLIGLSTSVEASPEEDMDQPVAESNPDVPCHSKSCGRSSKEVENYFLAESARHKDYLDLRRVSMSLESRKTVNSATNNTLKEETSRVNSSLEESSEDEEDDSDQETSYKRCRNKKIDDAASHAIHSSSVSFWGKRGYCRQFMTDKECMLEPCPYIHKLPPAIENSEGNNLHNRMMRPELLLKNIKSIDSSSKLLSLIKESMQMLSSWPTRTQCDIVLSFFECAIEVDRRCLSHIFDVIREFRVLHNRELCSELIHLCLKQGNDVLPHIAKPLSNLLCKLPEPIFVDIDQRLVERFINKLFEDPHHEKSVMILSDRVKRYSQSASSHISKRQIELENQMITDGYEGQMIPRAPMRQTSVRTCKFHGSLSFPDVYAQVASAVSENDESLIASIFRHIIKKKCHALLFALQKALYSDMVKGDERYKNLISSVSADRNYVSILQLEERYMLAQIGVALMFEAYAKQLYEVAFNILHSLHDSNTNYYECQFSILRNKNLVSKLPDINIIHPSGVMLSAISICLECSLPLQALKIFREFSWRVPEDFGTQYKTKINLERAVLFQRLCQALCKMKRFKEGVEILTKLYKTVLNDITVEKTPDEFAIKMNNSLNFFLAEMINDCNFSAAISLYENFELLNNKEKTELFEVKYPVLRGLVISACEIGDLLKAKEFLHFFLMLGMYQMSVDAVNKCPRCVRLQSYLSKHEIRLLLEYFMDKSFTMMTDRTPGIAQEKWYSTKIVILESCVEDETPHINMIHEIPTSLKEANQRVRCVLRELGLDIDERQAKLINEIYLSPQKIFQKYHQWKTRNDNDISIVQNPSQKYHSNRTLFYGEGGNNSSCSNIPEASASTDIRIPAQNVKPPTANQQVRYMRSPQGVCGNFGVPKTTPSTEFGNPIEKMKKIVQERCPTLPHISDAADIETEAMHVETNASVCNDRNYESILYDPACCSFERVVKNRGSGSSDKEKYSPSPKSCINSSPRKLKSKENMSRHPEVSETISDPLLNPHQNEVSSSNASCSVNTVATNSSQTTGENEKSPIADSKKNSSAKIDTSVINHFLKNSLSKKKIAVPTNKKSTKKFDLKSIENFSIRILPSSSSSVGRTVTVKSPHNEKSSASSSDNTVSSTQTVCGEAIAPNSQPTSRKQSADPSLTSSSKQTVPNRVQTTPCLEAQKQTLRISPQKVHVAENPTSISTSDVNNTDTSSTDSHSNAVTFPTTSEQSAGGTFCKPAPKKRKLNRLGLALSNLSKPPQPICGSFGLKSPLKSSDYRKFFFPSRTPCSSKIQTSPYSSSSYSTPQKCQNQRTAVPRSSPNEAGRKIRNYLYCRMLQVKKNMPSGERDKEVERLAIEFMISRNVEEGGEFKNRSIMKELMEFANSRIQ